MNDMAEKHNGMFGQVVKKSIRKLFPRFTKRGTVISPISKLLHITMPILPLPRRQWMIMIYECLNGCMSNPKYRGVPIHHHLRDYPMIIDSLWYNIFVTKFNFPSSHNMIKKLKNIYTNSSLASKWPDQQIIGLKPKDVTTSIPF